MDINNQLSSIVETLVEEIKQQVGVKAQESIATYLDDALSSYDLDQRVIDIARAKVGQKVDEYQFNTSEIKKQFDEVAAKVLAELKDTVHTKVTYDITQQIAKMDFALIVKNHIRDSVDEKFKNLTFPDNSINPSSIKIDKLVLSGDQIDGGIINNFSSTGIDDKASQCQVTILDTHVVIEQPILTTGIDVKGPASIDGTLTLNGVIAKDSKGYKDLIDSSVSAVKESLNESLFQGFTDLVVEKLKQEGIDADSVRVNGRAVVSEGELAPTVVKSNLRRLGELTELQVRGETLLDNTVFVAGKRMGINTLEPAGALAVWDEEVELVVRKKSSNTGYIGSTRDVTFILGSNNKENISLDPDGSVTINDLRLGALPISTASVEPNWAGRAGEIVFNDSPAIGKPIGWVCLEGHRWANFGTIQE